MIAYAPATGKELWRAKGLESNAVPSPVAVGDVVVLSAGYPAKVAMAIRAGGSGDVTGTPRVLWRHDKGTAYVPSPIAYEGRVYLVSDKGILTAVDALTGAIVYEGGRVPIPATVMASPVAYEGKILISSMEGDTFVIKAGADARGAEDQRPRRADRGLARHRARADLHPRRQAPLRDRRAGRDRSRGPRPRAAGRRRAPAHRRGLREEGLARPEPAGDDPRRSTAEEAAWRPGPGRHSVWELVVHAAYWKYAVRRRLTGEKRGSFALRGQQLVPRAPTPADEAAWKRDVRLLVEEHRKLRAVVASLRDRDLDRPAAGHRTRCACSCAGSPPTTCTTRARYRS